MYIHNTVKVNKIRENIRLNDILWCDVAFAKLCSVFECTSAQYLMILVHTYRRLLTFFTLYIHFFCRFSFPFHMKSSGWHDAMKYLRGKRNDSRTFYVSLKIIFFVAPFDDLERLMLRLMLNFPFLYQRRTHTFMSCLNIFHEFMASNEKKSKLKMFWIKLFCIAFFTLLCCLAFFAEGKLCKSYAITLSIFSTLLSKFEANVLL